MDFRVVDIGEYAMRREVKPALAGLAVGASGHDMRNRFVTYAGSGRVVLAEDKGIIAGSFGYSPVDENITCYSQSLLDELGSDKITFSHNVYVRPEYGGAGLSYELMRRFEKDAIDLGFEWHIDFKPKTEEISKWMHHISDNELLKSKDWQGGWLLARKLKPSAAWR